MIRICVLASLLASTVFGFTPISQNALPASMLKAAESEVSFEKLDGEDVRIGIIRTRWNDVHVTNLVDGAKRALKECNVDEDNIFETSVPGSFELPLAAKFLAMSGTVDAIIATGVLIKGDTLHFEYICDATSKALMNVGVQTNVPIVFGVLTCLDEQQVIRRSTGDNNHGYDWGKTAVEMSLLKNEAVGGLGKGSGMGFSSPNGLEEKKPEGEKKMQKVPRQGTKPRLHPTVRRLVAFKLAVAEGVVDGLIHPWI